MLAIVFTVFITVMTVNHTEGEQIHRERCPKWRYHYLDLSLEGKIKCKPCTICKPGFRQVTHCTRVDDTRCEPCRLDTYSSYKAKRCRPCKYCRQGGKFRHKCTDIEKAQCECPEGTYYKNWKCIPCTECLPGTYVMSQCSLTRDTQCRECQEGTYTTRTPNHSRYCAQCSHCRLGELITHTCNSTHNTVCGECRPGMFRQLSTYECVPCSLCYPDVNGSYSNAVIIDECRRRNPDQSRLCMPSVTTLPIYFSNNTEDVETNVSSIADMISAKTHARGRFFEGDSEELALFITTCILLTLVCLVLLSLFVAYVHRNAVNLVKCGNFCVKHQTTKPRVQRNLLDEYLVSQGSSQPYCFTRSNSANFPYLKTNNHQSNATTVSLETGKMHYFTEKEFYPSVRWTFGTGTPSVSSFSDIFSVSTTGTLSSNKGESDSRQKY